MRRIAVCCTAAVLAACSPAKEQPAAAPPAAPAAPAAPAPLTRGDVAGKWIMTTMPADKDTVILTFEMVATASDSGWTVTFPKRKPEAVRVVAVAGDSVVTEAGPYESALRKGVKVWTHSTYRLKDGKLVGIAIAHYAVKTADSVRTLRSEGTRAP
jgi:hypothetical protein